MGGFASWRLALDDALDGRGLRIVRYADDFVILSKDRTGDEAALARAHTRASAHQACGHDPPEASTAGT
jgi:hypothetical protein